MGCRALLGGVVTVLGVGYGVLAEPMVFSTPVNVAELNSPYVDRGPTLSADGLEVFFSSDRPGKGASDIWRATRPSTSAGWSTPVNVSELNTPGGEGTPNLCADGLTLFFSRYWAGQTALTDIYVATRPDRFSPFSPASPVAEVNSAEQEGSPFVSADMLTVYFDRAVTVETRSDDPFFAKRARPTDHFGTPTRIDELSTASSDRDLWVSPDARTIIFASNRPSAFGTAFHIFQSTRPDPNGTFGPPQLLEGVNSTYGEAEPCFNEATRSLWFLSDRPGGAGSTDIWMAQLVPEPFSLAFMGSAFAALVGWSVRRRMKAK